MAQAGRVVGALACQRNSYLRSLQTVVLSCIELPRAQRRSETTTHVPETIDPKPAQLWQIECADSVLFPEGLPTNSQYSLICLGGGQPSDHGTIIPLNQPDSAPIPVTAVQRDGLRCVWYSPRPLVPGTLVHQEIDFRRRWDHMQQHTGQHLLSAILDRYHGLSTIGWGMGIKGEMTYVELPRKPSDEELCQIQTKCNEVIRNNIQITVQTPQDVSADSLPDDYDKDNGVVRVVRIGNLDANT